MTTYRSFVTPRLTVLAKLLEGALLQAPDPARRMGRGLLEDPMQSFMPPILLRVPGLNPFRPDPQANPPHGQPRQPTQSHRGKRRPIVTPNRRGSPNSRNAATNTGCTVAEVVSRTCWHRSKYRLASRRASRDQSGSHRASGTTL